jgi:ATP dependent DNA ligase domain
MELLLQKLETLQETTGKKAKSTYITENKTDKLFIKVLEFLYNPFKVSGISTKKLNKDVDKIPNTMNLSELLDYLTAHNTGTDYDIGIIKYFLDKHDNNTILSQLISKTLTLGVSGKSINDALGESLVPTFDVQLAFPYDKTITSTSTKRQIDRYDDDDLLYVTQKLDGFRGLTTYKTKIQTYSRKGQLIDGLDELHQDIENVIQASGLLDMFPNGFAIDGELLLKNEDNLTSDALFRATTKELRKNGKKQNITYNIFDILPLDEFYYKDASTQMYKERRAILDTIQSGQFTQVVPVLDVITKNDIPKWSNYASDQGWEGIMLNYANGYYRTKRSAELLKVKKMHTADLEIVGFNQAIDGKNAGQLQSINVKLDDENVVQVGSGLTEELRLEIWNNQDKYLGAMVEIQYFELSENQNGGKSLRFPVFKDFRFDKTPDDANIE